jgi:hypothetical protein
MELLDAKRIEPVDGHPDGRYEGRWSGYVVEWETEFGRYEARSRDGVRGLVPVTVVVECGRFSFVKSN